MWVQDVSNVYFGGGSGVLEGLGGLLLLLVYSMLGFAALVVILILGRGQGPALLADCGLELVIGFTLLITVIGSVAGVYLIGRSVWRAGTSNAYP